MNENLRLQEESNTQPMVSLSANGWTPYCCAVQGQVWSFVGGRLCIGCYITGKCSAGQLLRLRQSH